MYAFLPLMRNLPNGVGRVTLQDALKQSLVHRHSVHFPLLPMLHCKCCIINIASFAIILEVL